MGLYFYFKDPELFERETTNINQKEMLLEKKEQIESLPRETLNVHYDEFIGKSTEELIEAFGEPIRKDLSKYGYTSYIYIEDLQKYLIFGIKGGEVVTVIGTGSSLAIGDITVGDSYEKLKTQLNFKEEIRFRKGTSSYKLQLAGEDIIQRPVVPLEEGLFLQLYFDTLENKLIGFRFMDKETLLIIGAFDVVYRGHLPEVESLTKDELSIVERNEEQQIFEITNIIRNYYGKAPLEKDEAVQEVAFLHSRDMVEENYFSHENKRGENLSDRLNQHHISYRIAGENIASNYTDALAVVIGWLNSEGHRDSLLREDFTHIGIGVYENYYTQNFIKK